MKLTDRQWVTIIKALRKSADEDDKVQLHSMTEGVREQFATQAKDKRALADYIEDNYRLLLERK